MSALMDFLSFCLQPALGCYLLRLPILGNIGTAYDTYNRAITTSGSLYFAKSSHGYALNNGSTGRAYVAHGAEQFVTEGTIFFGSAMIPEISKESAPVRIINKRSATDVYWDLQYEVVGNRFNMYDGGSRRFVVDVDLIYRSIGIGFEHNQYFQCYLDGIYKGQADSASSFSATGTPEINIQCQAGGGTSHNLHLQALALFSVKLTPQEMSDIHTAFDRVSISTMEPQLTKALPLVVQNPLVYLDGYITNGKAIDASPNGHHFTKSNGVEMVPDVPAGVSGFDAHGGNREPAVLTRTDTALDDLAPVSFSFWALRDGPTALNSGRIYEKGPATKFLIQTNNIGSIIMYDSWSGGLAQFYESNVLTLYRWYYVAIRYARTVGSVPQISIDGSAFSDMTVGLASSGTKNSDTGTAYVFNSSDANREYEGTLADFKVHDSYITQQESDSIHLRGALRVCDRGYDHVYADSIASKSAGNIGPFSIISGTHKWEDNILSCSSTGQAHTQNGDAFGAYYFKLYKAGDANTVEFSFIASDSSALLTTSQNVYTVTLTSAEDVRLRRFDGAGATNLISTASDYIALNTWYEFFSSRSQTGVFKLWIRGGAYSTWTLVGTSAADTTYTKSNYSIVSLGSGDKFSSYMRFPYGSGLEPNDIPLLAD